MQNSDNKKIIDVNPEEERTKDTGDDLVKVEARPRVADEAPKNAPNVSIGTLNIFNAPFQGIQEPLERRYYRYYEDRHPHGKKHLLVDALLFLAVVGLLGFNFVLYLGFGKPHPLTGVALTMSATPEMPRNGDVMTVTTTYKNENTVELTNVTMTFHLPPRFRLDERQSTFLDPKTRTVTLGTLAPGANGSVVLTGQLYGNRGEEVPFSTQLNARDADDQKVALLKVSLQHSAITSTIVLPKRIVTNAPFAFSFTVQNDGGVTSVPLVVTPIWPAGFVVEKTTPALTNNTFALEALASGGKKEITVSGTLKGSGETEAVFRLTTSGRADGDVLTLETLESRVPVFYPRLSLRLASDPPLVTLGEPLTLTMMLENNEPTSVVDVTAEIVLRSDIFDSASIQTTGEKTENSVLFRSPKTSTLAFLKPKQKEELSLTVTPKKHIDPLLVFGAQPREIVLNVSASYRLETDLQERIPVIGDAIRLPLNSNLGLEGFARYYSAEGEQLGRGPLPPIVDTTTKYWLFLHLTNTIHPLTNVAVTAVLPEYISWTKKANVTFGDAVRFDAATRTLIWQLESVPALEGDFLPEIGALLELALTPTQEQIGTTPLLATQIHVEGTDSVTGAVLTADSDGVTTNLTHDRKAAGKGTIAP